MNLWDEDYIEPQTKRQRGRPVENPFPTPECEEEFVRRGAAVLASYFHPGEAGTRLDFDFGSKRLLSKTQFWAIIYIYYTEDKKLLRKNLQGFLNAVIRHFGPAVVSDRAGIEKNIGSQLRLHVCFKHAFADSSCPDTVRDRLCKQYQFVVHRWEESCRQI